MQFIGIHCVKKNMLSINIISIFYFVNQNTIQNMYMMSMHWFLVLNWVLYIFFNCHNGTVFQVSNICFVCKNMTDKLVCHISLSNTFFSQLNVVFGYIKNEKWCNRIKNKPCILKIYNLGFYYDNNN